MAFQINAFQRLASAAVNTFAAPRPPPPAPVAQTPAQQVGYSGVSSFESAPSRARGLVTPSVNSGSEGGSTCSAGYVVSDEVYRGGPIHTVDEGHKATTSSSSEQPTQLWNPIAGAKPGSSCGGSNAAAPSSDPSDPVVMINGKPLVDQYGNPVHESQLQTA